jgi:hypothetical protein
MRSKFKIATAVTGICVLGLGTASILHAQTSRRPTPSSKSMSKIRTATRRIFYPKRRPPAANTLLAALTKRSALVDRRHQTA